MSTKDRLDTLAITSLLSTKLFVPQPGDLANLLSRTHLIERLQNGLARKLTLVSAPAGYGKTMLLAEWSLQSKRRVSWLSLDETDNDLARFLTYCIAALQGLKPDFGAALLGALQVPQLPPLESLITALVNEMISLADFALVLDDYHLIHLPAIHTAITFLLNHLPPNLHLVIISRADPPLPLARLRVRGEMTELRSADLRFTQDEANAFFQQVKALPLTAEQIQELDTRTEGWGAGLHLAALSLKELDSRAMTRFINAFTGSHRDVFDYLAEEVLQQQSPEIHHFLLRTSILSRLCDSLCDAVLNDREREQRSSPRPELGEERTTPPLVSSREILEYLEHANLFLVSLDGRRHWYRYHHLFVDFLRQRLMQEVGALGVNDLYRRASGWFEQHGLLGEAIDYAILARDFERAARLVDAHSASVQAQGELATLLRWLTALPDAAFDRRPTLALNHAFTLAVLDQFSAAERRLDAAERALHAAPVQDVELLGQAAMVRAAIAQLTDLSAEVTIAACLQALELLPQRSTNWRRMTELFLGVAYYIQAGNLRAGYQTLIELEQASLDSGDPFSAVHTYAHMTIALEIGGRLRESERRSRESLQRTNEPFWQGVPLTAYARFGLGRVLYERNELLAARDLLIPAIQQLEAWSLKRPLIIAIVVLARVQQALGEPTLALATMARVVAMVQQDNLKQTYSYWAEYQVRMALALGDLRLITKWTNETEPTISGELNPALEYTHITLAYVYWAQGRLDEAQRLLDRLLPAAEAAARMGRVLEILLLHALTADAQGQRTAALTTLERALTIAEPEGYIRTFVDLGPAMAALLREAHVRDIKSAYIATLLAAFPDFGGSPAGALLDLRNEAPPIVNRKASDLPVGITANLLEPLSARELEVLALMAQGLTNPEIAHQIYISDQTVKVHTRNIYGKLGVNDRKQAVVKARALGLIL